VSVTIGYPAPSITFTPTTGDWPLTDYVVVTV